MPSTSPDINKLKADKNEQDLIKALNYLDDPDIPVKAAQALAGIGTIDALEPLCSLMENSELSIQIRIETAVAIGDICARFLKDLDHVNPDSLSEDELRRHRDGNQMLSRAGSRLKLSMKTGPLELRKAAGNAYLILPLDDDSDIMKAFSNGSTATFQSTQAATDPFAQIQDESDPPSPEPLKKIQNIEVDAEDQNDQISIDKAEEVIEEEVVEEEVAVVEEEAVEEEVAVVEEVVEEEESVEEEVVESEPEVHIEIQKQMKKQDSSEPNLDEFVEIAPNTYWIGTREGSLIEQNIYLRIFSEGNKTINLLIDPGSPDDLPALVRALSSKIGGLKNIDVMFLNHQDPDVAYNAGHLQELNPDCFVLCSEDSWRQVKSYGLNPKKYKAIEQFKDLTVEMSTGHRLRFVPSPYCHFRGAVMLYDEETGILFSGDFLGGLSSGPDLYATEDSWEGISTFHQIYMPCQTAIRNTVNSIRSLDTLPEIIAPQHGSIISGALINDFLGRVDYLEVGIDLFLKEHSKEYYIEAMNDILSEFGKIAGPATKTEVLNAILSDSSFPNVISLGANGIHDIKVDPYFAVGVLLRALQSKTPPEIWKTAEISILKVLTRLKITIPDAILQKASDQMVFILADRFMSGVSEDSV
ncbi:MAG: hypothetical protein KAR44_02005 [Candidatus Aegiribacteria sp.]|nr:hypothetical protein [Candidatus Aegiribacteria sp.]